MHDLTSISADLDNFHFLAFIRDFQKFQNGLEQKLVDRFGWNFFSDVYLSIGSPNKKRLLLAQLFEKSGHPIFEVLTKMFWKNNSKLHYMNFVGLQFFVGPFIIPIDHLGSFLPCTITDR